MTAAEQPEPPLLPFGVDDFSPTLAFPRVLQTLRRAHRAGRLDEALDLFLLAWRPALSRQAFLLVHARNLDPNTWADDALAVVMLQVYDRLPRLVASTVPVQNLLAFLRQGMTRAFDAYLDSPGGLDGRGEMSNVHRRRMRLTTLRQLYRTRYGVEPGADQAFLDWANAELGKTHKNPGRSGMVFTAADLAPVESVLSTDADGGESLAVAQDEPDTGVLSALDRKRLAAAVIHCAEGIDPTLHRCAEVMFASQLTDQPEAMPGLKDVTQVLHVRSARADQLCTQVKGLARDILAERFGIDGVDDP
ncbi:hypothetical protein [Microlunatus ginsengisoli]|uniref:hypothetical protein n=1 Tax=Microlunatus ginsengisoli TaxID=363863 RepID=UPI0031DE807C